LTWWFEALGSAASRSNVQVTVAPESAQLDGEAETNVTPAGSVSVNTTLVASAGPMSVTVAV